MFPYSKGKNHLLVALVWFNVSNKLIEYVLLLTQRGNVLIRFCCSEENLEAVQIIHQNLPRKQATVAKLVASKKKGGN